MLCWVMRLANCNLVQIS
uniref:Uncharacterized protein n=1 Tax=Rhizophora mucronata TaxID=61149 RepID=A0A2P2P7B3_RHIMU